jgi:hypothetical protein
MYRKLACAAFVLVVAFGMVAGGEYTGRVMKVDGNKITFQKMKGKGKNAEKDGDPVTWEVAKDAKIIKGMFNKDTKKVEAGDAIEGGLTGTTFSKIDAEKGIGATVTTDDDKKVVTQIMVFGGKKKNQ